METIPKADCQNIGFIRKTHGIHGELVLEFETRFEYSIEDATRFFIEIDGLLVPFFVKEGGIRFRSAISANINLELVESEKYAKRLVGSSVYLYLDEIIDEEEQTIESKLKGYLLVDENIGEIGIVEQVDDYAGNVVITMKYRGEEILIPYNDDFLVEVNEMNKSIKLKLPDGLIDAGMGDIDD